MTDDASRPLRDPSVLRAIAHPVRNQILYELTGSSGARAADLAKALGLPANAVSFHLHQLAKYDLIEEAPELARDGRDRVWRLTSQDAPSIALESVSSQPGGAAAVDVWRREAAAWAHTLVDSATHSRPADSDSVVSIADVPLRLTHDEARALTAALMAFLRNWSASSATDAHHPGGGALPADEPSSAERQKYIVLSVIQPAP